MSIGRSSTRSTAGFNGQTGRGFSHFARTRDRVPVVCKMTSFSTVWRTVWTTVDAPGTTRTARGPAKIAPVSRKIAPRDIPPPSTGFRVWTTCGWGNPLAVDTRGHVDNAAESRRTPRLAASNRRPVVDRIADNSALLHGYPQPPLAAALSTCPQPLLLYSFTYSILYLDRECG